MDAHKEIARMRASGYSLQDTYIYVKDYVSLESCVEVYEGHWFSAVQGWLVSGGSLQRRLNAVYSEGSVRLQWRVESYNRHGLRAGRYRKGHTVDTESETEMDGTLYCNTRTEGFDTFSIPTKLP
jgi:hypothetical protein